MKRSFFAVAVVLSFVIVYSQCLANTYPSGIMNAPLHNQNLPHFSHYFHGGVDLYWTMLNSTASSNRPYAVVPTEGLVVLDARQFYTLFQSGMPTGNPQDIGVDYCINPVSTETILNGRTVYRVMPSQPVWFGLGHAEIGRASCRERV